MAFNASIYAFYKNIMPTLNEITTQRGLFCEVGGFYIVKVCGVLTCLKGRSSLQLLLCQMIFRERVIVLKICLLTSEMTIPHFSSDSPSSDLCQEPSSLQLVCFLSTGTTEGVPWERRQFLLVETENRTVVSTESYLLCNILQEVQSRFIISFSLKSQCISKRKHYGINALISFWKTPSEKQILKQHSLFHFANDHIFS